MFDKSNTIPLTIPFYMAIKIQALQCPVDYNKHTLLCHLMNNKVEAINFKFGSYNFKVLLKLVLIFHNWQQLQNNTFPILLQSLTLIPLK